MPTKQTLELIEKIQTDLAALAGASIDSLVRQGDLGTAMSFEPLSGEFEGMTNLAAQLRSVDLASFPLQRLQRLAGFISALLVDLEKVKTFNPTTANATEQRQQLMASVTQNYSKLLDDATPFLTVGLMRTANLKAAVDSINTELARAKASHQKVEEVLKESTAVLEKVRGVSAETGVAAHSTAFDQQAERHKKAARAWMIATLALGVVAAVFAFLLFQGSLAGSDAIWTGGHAVRSIAFRVVLLSFFTYFIAWSARNYRANRHNEVVNTHRRIALSTFETFAKAAEGDKDTKNAVLIQTTQAIFSAQRSGYLGKEPDAGPQSTIVEILRGSTTEK